MADNSTIESYDRSAEKWAKRQREGKSLAHEYLEKPAMYSKLPDLEGKSVLCIGCGSGEECGVLKKRGAARVVGIDLSRGLIEQAKYAYPDCEFMVMDMERLDFSAGSFDFIYSSLALHYAQDWRNILKPAYKTLKDGGTFLFSTHHPVKWGGEAHKESGVTSNLLGYNRDEQETVKVYGDYLNTRRITENLIDGLNVSYYHKSLSEIFKEIRESGFELADFIEPKPTAAALKARASFFEIYDKIPLFMILELKKS